MNKKSTFSRGLFLMVCIIAMTNLAFSQTSGQWGQWCYKDYSYTGSVQTFTVPANCTKVTIEAIGGGGAGGYAYKGFLAAGVLDWSHDYYRVGGGGGGAAYARTENRAVSAGNAITINVGQGGRNSGDGGATTVYFSGTKWLEAAGGKHGQWSRSGHETENLHAAGGAGGAASDSYYFGTGTTQSGGTGGKAKDYGTGLSADKVGSGSGGGAAGGTGPGVAGAEQSGGNSNAISSEGGNGGGGATSGLISGVNWLKGGKGANGLYGTSGWGDGGAGAAPGAGGSGGRADENHGPFNGGNGGDGMVRVWFYIENTNQLTLNVQNNSSTCPYTLSATASNEVFTKNYKWSTGATSASITVSPSSNTTYTVTVTDVYSDANNSCQITSTNSIMVDECLDCSVSISSATATPSVICQGTSTTLAVTLESEDASTTYNFEWTSGGSSVGTGASITLTPASTATYKVSVTATKGSCTANDTRDITVTVNEKVDPVFASLEDKYCASSTLTLPTTSDNGITGTWDDPTATTVGDHTEKTYVFTPASSECANPFTKTIKFYSDPTPGEIEPNIVYCSGLTSESFNNKTSAAGGINGQYAWQVSLNGTDSWVTIPTANTDSYIPMTDLNAISTSLGVSVTGTLYYRRAWTNDCGNVYSNVLSLDNPGTLAPGSITVTGSAAGAYCADKSVSATLTANPTAEVTSPTFSYQWQSSTDGSTWTDISGETNNTYNVSLNPVQKISYRYKVKYSTCDWLTSNNTYDITVNNLPEVKINGENPCNFEKCKGTTVTATASGAESYKWSGSGSTANPATILGTGTYTVTGTDDNGCSNTAEIIITENNLAVTITGNLPDCYTQVNGYITYTISGGHPNFDVNLVKGGAVVASKSGESAGGQFDGNITDGSYTVKVKEVGGQQCEVTSDAVTVAFPTVTLNVPGTKTVYLPEGVSKVDVDPGTATFTPTDGAFTVENNLVNPLAQGSHDIDWVLKDACGNPIATGVQTIKVEYKPCATPVVMAGGTYNIKRIGSQCWFTTNLKENVGTHSPYGDESSNTDKFGFLYTWYAAVNVAEGTTTEVPATFTGEDGKNYVQGICPTGWSIGSTEDYNILDAYATSTKYLKDPSTEYWMSGFQGESPGTGFNARGGGLYNSALARYEDLKTGYHFWKADSPGVETLTTSTTVIACAISYYCDKIIEEEARKNDMRSVRCIRKVAP